jgi:hypothetical protein
MPYQYYDLGELPPSHQPPLRPELLARIEQFLREPRRTRPEPVICVSCARPLCEREVTGPGRAAETREQAEAVPDGTESRPPS